MSKKRLESRIEELERWQPSTQAQVFNQFDKDALDLYEMKFHLLHGIFVAQGLLAVTGYKAHLSGGTGRFANATGDFSNIGEVDFGTGHAILRYSGTVCYGGN